jgi:hypothetical protein
MSNFPLYENLLKDLENISVNKDKFIKLVKDFDNNGYEIIYALIKFYQFKNNKENNMYKIPYGGKHNKDEIKFDYNELPDDLKKILYKFTIMHTDIIKEENILKKNRDCALNF